MPFLLYLNDYHRLTISLLVFPIHFAHHCSHGSSSVNTLVFEKVLKDQQWVAVVHLYMAWPTKAC